LALRLLLKRGALLAAANWPLIAIQFVAETLFQVLLGAPVIGAAFLVAVLLGGDFDSLLRESYRETLTTIGAALTSEPVALAAFVLSFGVALLGGSMLMFLVKGGTIDVLLAANDRADAIERQPVTAESLHRAAAFSVRRYWGGCARLFRPYLRLGLLLMLAYALSAAAYLAIVVVGYRAAAAGVLFGSWAFVVTLVSIVLVLWITLVNVVYLLLQVIVAVDGPSVAGAFRSIGRFARVEFPSLGGIFLLVLAMVCGTTLATAVAWSAVGLVAFVPLVGLAVIPLQIAAFLLRGLAYQYIGLTAAGAYVTLYRRHKAAEAGLPERSHLKPSPLGHPA
jgi:hypothetical protein